MSYKNTIKIIKFQNRKIFHIEIIILFLLICISFILRLLTCFWGYPYPLHPDEPTIVNNAIDMISRHSWEVNVYNRPDHFEIKCNALLFQIISYIKYHTSADLAFPDHTMTFYLIARGFTAIWGVLSILLIYVIIGKIMPKVKLLAAFIVVFFPIFIQQSAYATPDMVLTFFILMDAYIGILYLEQPSTKYLILMSIACGLGITVKYTCAISCIWIALVVCINSIKKKEYISILKQGLLALLCVFLITFFMAPNLYTNISKTIQTLRFEARNTHLGADGLGFGGNLLYYLNTFLSSSGYETFVGLIFGLLYCIKKHNKYSLTLGLGIIYWICTSVLSLHWERWGMPMYIFGVMIVAVGIGYLHDIFKNHKYIKLLLRIVTGIIMINYTVSGLLIVQNSLLKDSRIAALEFCELNSISANNAYYDGYTPFAMRGGGNIGNLTYDQDGKMVVSPEKEYIIISSSMYGRYYAEPDRYKNIIKMYDDIQRQNKLIYEVGGGYYSHSPSAVINVFYAVKGLHTGIHVASTGNVIKIYKIL